MGVLSAKLGSAKIRLASLWLPSKPSKKANTKNRQTRMDATFFESLITLFGPGFFGKLDAPQHFDGGP